MKIVVCDRLEAKATRKLQEKYDQVVLLESPDRQTIIEHSADADAIIVRSHTVIDRTIIENSPRLRVLGRAGSGSYNIDVEAASKRGIVVLHTPFISSTSTAELAIALLIGAARKLKEATADMAGGKWDRGALNGLELSGQTVGIIGYGNIGRKVAAITKAIGMEVLAYDPYVRYQQTESPVADLVSLDELLTRSTAVIVCCPRTPETAGMFNAALFARMRAGSLLVNVGHGQVVVEKDLIAALDSGHLFGAGLDVFEEEPTRRETAVVQHPRVYTTPHIGAATMKAQEGVCTDIVDKVIGFLDNGYISGSINLPVVDENTEVNIQGYIELAGKLASMVSQLDPTTTRLCLQVNGKLAFSDTGALENRVAREFLLARRQEASDINARFLLDDQGISISLGKAEQGSAFVNEVEVATDNYSLKGTLLADKFPRIVEVNEYKIEAVPQGTMLFFRNYDRPGVIGSLGRLLGEKNINVANMRLGFRGDDEAIAMVNIDTAVDAATLQEITRLDNIIDCFQLEFT